ncbi:translocation/assembly module TamB domain-containing protein [Hymenobacter properus]|uniref:Translocation/assembly module TamB domain-containing protein n=1 Tax=Hymenobacter properus TaxID=2791026 RepID=A0A931BJS9_9BACT|nr:translocation/assembly module TamB [Hymenobacter properus]MBF9141543.1 translocation/assembly module TamB domain-containing protein [Hymenobacter properus]MBR7720352.1 translocation/assembly module TamB domain-containing protein [Microvirga sp. SRT04]
MSTFLRRALYGLLGLIALVLLLVVAVVVFLQFDAGQDFVAKRAENYLRGKLGTEVRIGKFRTDFRHAINLDGVYLEDQQRDTLLSVGHLGVDLAIWDLLHKQINVSNIELNDGRVRLTRTEPDSVNNYDFIIKAFTDPTAPVDTTASGLKYDIGKARLTNIYFTQLDQITGSDIRARIGEFTANMDEVDVDNSIYKVDKAALRRSAISIVQTKTAPEVENPGPTEPLTLQFGLNRATLDSVQFTYKNNPAAQYINTNIGLADITAKDIDLQRQRVNLGKLTLKNTTFAYAQNEQVPVEERVVNPAEAVRKLDEATDKAKAATGQAAASPGWRVNLDQSDISGLAVKFDNFNQPQQRTRIPALDYNHLDFTNLVLNTRDLRYSENRTTGKVDNLAGQEKSGFRVDSWKANVVYDSVQIRLDSLDLVTPHTRIRRTLAIGYESLAALGDVNKLPNLKIEGDLRDVRLGFRDILYLAPDLAGTSPFNTGPNQSVLLNGQVAGRVGDMTIRNFEFVGLRNTIVKVPRIHITGLPEVDGRLYVDANLRQFSSSRADVLSLAPKGSIPNNISIPPTFAVSGTFKGYPTTLQFNTDLQARTSYGNLAFSGNLGRKQANGQQPLVGTFAIGGFDFGKLLKDPTIGRVTATGRINATGNLQDPGTLVGQVRANVQSARYNGYTYKGVAATVDLDRNRYVINASSKNDPNLNLDLSAVVNLRDPRNPTYEVTNLNLRGANLTALGFYTGGDLRVQGNLKANLRGSNLNTLNGTFSGQKIVIVRDNQPFALDSLNGRIVQTATRTTAVITSDIANVNLDGNVHLGDIATELQQHLDRYFDVPGVRYVPSTADRHFTYSLKLKDPRLATKLVPGLKKISPFTLAGDYSRQAARLTANTSIPLIQYNNYRLDSLRLNVDSDPSKLDFGLRLAQAAQDTTLRLRRPSVVGNIANNKVFARAAILGDSANRERLALAGTVQALAQPGGKEVAYQFEAAPEQIINYQNWTAGANNYVRYYPSGAVVADGLNLTNGRSTLALQSQNPQVPTSPLGVTFTNFELAELARIVQQQDSLVAGQLNGTARIDNLGKPNQAFTADATIKNLVFQKASIGDIAFQATNPAPSRYDIDARLTGGAAGTVGGAGNDVHVTGTYLASSPTPLNLTVDANRLNLKLVEPFSVGQVRSATGYIRGQLTVTGAPSAPIVRGTLNTSDDAGFIVPQLGSPFRLPNQALTFDVRGIAFNNFTVLDSASNKAVINGYLLSKDFINYAFDMRATTNDFLAVRSTRENNELFYGRLVLDSETRLTGPVDLIKIDTRVTVVDGSNLTVESPAATPTTQERTGIVEFIDKSAPLDTMLARKVAVDTTKVNATGYDITAVVTITNRTPFTIVIDPASGDNLKVRAAGTLNTNIAPDGTISLSGRLDVARGQYHMSLYNLAQRDFILSRGSSITWDGDPYNATLDLTAIYKVQAAPAELLAGQGTDDLTSATVSRNRLPFNVLLKVTDQLSKPTIGFDITLPENQRGALNGQVEAKLAQLRQPNQTSELSKQVFSLLILGRFVAQNPFQTSSGEGLVATQLRGSASAVLTDQLTNLTDKYLSGLGLDLGVTNQAAYGADGSQGSRTDLNVGLRRQLLNNRLTVRVGTDINLSGGTGTQATRGQNSASNLAGDVSIEYRVLADGRLRVRVFRQNSYEDIDGQIIRTGAALVFQRDYQDLKELFSKVPKDIKAERRADKKDAKAEKKAEKDSVQSQPSARVDTTRTPKK